MMDRLDASSLLMQPPSLSRSSVQSLSDNPRKRKKSSRACDFCHINHQPCDNAQPRCSYCERHDKSCLYLRPQKKRGPAQGYRSALYAMRESAAAWGAALSLIPSLAPVIEGYLQKPEGRRLIKAIKDPQQQEYFVQAWQQSSLFKSFFGGDAVRSKGGGGPAKAGLAADDGDDGGDDGDDGDDGSADADAVAATADAAVRQHGKVATAAEATADATAAVASTTMASSTPDSSSRVVLDTRRNQLPLSLLEDHLLPPPPPPPPPPSSSASSSLPAAVSLAQDEMPVLAVDLSFAPLMNLPPPPPPPLQHALAPLSLHSSAHASDKSFAPDPGQFPVSLSDILARDAATSANNFSQTLGSLGFASTETVDDFLAISYNPDPMDAPTDLDPLLGTEMDQKAYYELLMGKTFP